MLRMRLGYTQHLQRLHKQTMAEHSHMKTPVDEDREYDMWHAKQQEARRVKSEDRNRLESLASPARQRLRSASDSPKHQVSAKARVPVGIHPSVYIF